MNVFTVMNFQNCKFAILYHSHIFTERIIIINESAKMVESGMSQLLTKLRHQK